MARFIFAFFLFGALTAQAQVFQNISNLQTALGFNKYYGAKKSRAVRVAIFDKGFEGYQAEIGKSLPANTVYVPGPVAAPQDMKVEHGLRMAQIFTALATKSLEHPDVIQEFYLYNVYGFTNFKAAVDDAIKRKIDVISYSEVWEYGGNNDGKGFINAQVSRATAAGIIWVNAVGNFGKTTYNSSIQTLTEDWVKLPDQNNALAIKCEKTAGSKCMIKAVLSWNDFKNDIDPGTDKDLDLALTDDMLNILQTSALRQSADPREERPGYSKYAREILTAELKPGTYYLRVKNRSKNFGTADRLRITVDGDSISMPRSTTDESVLNPGDNLSVITVGASDSDRSSISKKMNKPDIVAPSSMILTDDSEFRGSSNATAIVAAGVALLKAKNPQINKTMALTSMSKDFNWDKGSINLNYLRFSYTGGNCFKSREWAEAPAYIKQAVAAGGVLVETTMQYRIMVPYDPFELTGQQRSRADEMVVILPEGNYQVVSRNGQVPQGAAEVFQRPVEAGLCSPPAKRSGRMFRL